MGARSHTTHPRPPAPQTQSVSLNKYRCLTPVTSSIQTWASKLNSTQYCRNQAYNDALNKSLFPRTILQWNSLASSVVDAESAEVQSPMV